jgi:hypothetical protein
MEQNMEAEGNRSGVATYIIEAFVALLILILGLTVAYQAVQLGHRWGTDGPGSGYFPFYIGVILSICSAVVLFQALFGKSKNTEIFVDGEQLKRVLTVLIPAAIFVGSIEFLGMYVANAIYIALFMIILGKNSILKSVLVGLGTQTVFFLAFEVWFKVPLYKGSLDLLGFLGY